MLSYGRQARYRTSYTHLTSARLRHLSPQTSPGALLLMASSAVSASASRKSIRQMTHIAPPYQPLDGEILALTNQHLNAAYMPVHKPACLE